MSMYGPLEGPISGPFLSMGPVHGAVPGVYRGRKMLFEDGLPPGYVSSF